MKKELVPLETLNLTCGTVVIHQLYGIDMRSILSMYGGKASQVDLSEAAALRSTTVNGKPLTMDMLDEMPASDYLEIMGAQVKNFQSTTAQDS